MDKAVHLILPVSFLIVKTVVEQGQWKRYRITILIAVKMLHPFETNISLIAESDESSLKLPLER